jgi:hypothetical protein
MTDRQFHDSWHSRQSLWAYKIAVAGVSVFFSLPLGIFALSITAFMSTVWLVCSSPLSSFENEFQGNHRLDLDQ